jgi:hypothetical protein
MRHFWALLAYVTAVVVAASSCAAGNGHRTSGFASGNGGTAGATGGSGTSTGGANASGGAANGGSSGAFMVPDAGPGMCPAYKSCAQAGYNCGQAPDGCGNLQNCGTCSDPTETCGGGGTQNVCGKPPCIPATCMSLGYDCGMASDGCNGTLDCGGADGGPDCPMGQVCGGNGKPNQCSPGVCVPQTCQQQGFNCGMQGDTCGNAIDCGTCPMNQVCGGGTNPKSGVCGTVCTPKTCAQQGYDCGAATDGCGGIINCGTCTGNQTCGGGGPNKCGVQGGTCTNLCLQQQTCPMMGQTTSISGTVYAPNGVDPLPNTLVYVPNAPLQTWTDGVSSPHCSCSADVSGSPLVSAVTDYKGNFTIGNMPVGMNIPLVIQNGRWRRLYTIPNVAACTNTPIPTSGPQQLRMPQVQAEFTKFDNIPLMTFVTGSVDSLECVLRKIGIADSQFSDPAAQGGKGRVRFYLGDSLGLKGSYPFSGGGATYSANTPDESQLWGAQTEMNSYDLAFFPCKGAEWDRTSAAQQTIINYANAGGRVFATHFSYVWLFNDAPFSMTAQWNVNQPGNFTSYPETAYIVTSFPKGNILAQWLQYISASTVFGQMPIDSMKRDFDAVNMPAGQLWIYLIDPNYPTFTNPGVPMHYTFDTPVGVPPAQQCGKVLYNDYHVENAESAGLTFPSECNTLPAFTPQEKLLEYLIFDLGGCVEPATCPPQTCTSQNIQCGPAPDGCGNIIMCGSCPSGETCIAGKCAAGCTPQSCSQQGFVCGMQGDGCGNVQDCGTCPSGTCGGGGQPGKCGSGTCTPKSCAQQKYACGSVGDGCGNIINCGTCPQGEICGGMTPGQCYTAPCTPKTCVELGYNCGEALDGCGNIINCGTCVAPQTCGGGIPPMANVCGGGAN